MPEESVIELWQHENGSLYAVEIDSSNRIVRASGELEDTELKLAMNGIFDGVQDVEWFLFYSHQFAKLQW